MKTAKQKFFSKVLALMILITMMVTSFISVANANILDDIFKKPAVSTTSFTEFKGGLQAPSTEGYDKNLVQQTSARAFILQVTNFFLGFLGLIAVVIIIYGGFMYVTDAGKGEAQKKGKTAITSALIGIIIILGSYAIVNTILQAPQGTDLNLKGAADQQTGAGNTAIQQRFNTISGRVDTMLTTLANSILFTYQARKDLDTIKDSVDAATKALNAPDSANWLSIAAELEKARDITTGIKTHIPSSTANQAAIISALDDIADKLKGVAQGFRSIQSRLNLPTPSVPLLTPSVPSIPPELKENLAEISSIIDDLRLKDGLINTSFAETINSIKIEILEIYQQVGQTTSSGDELFKALVSEYQKILTIGLDQNSQVDGITGNLEALKQAVKTDTTSDYINIEVPLRAAVETMNSLFVFLKDIKFVDARITASATSGNAPLAVSFSSVGSTDPSGVTITPAQISWDLNGDGKYNNTEISTNTSSGVPTGEGSTLNDDYVMNCDEKSLVVTTCTFKEPGTYRVKVRIYSSVSTNPVTGKAYNTEIAAGIATLDINVNPPQNKINLNLLRGSADSKGIDIIKYDPKSGEKLVDRDTVFVSANTAKTDGITFNAELTTTKEGTAITEQAAEGAKVKWDFGINSLNTGNQLLEASKTNLHPAAVKYEKAGDYNVSVQVMDKNQVTDTKFVTLKVSALSPNIFISNLTPKVGEEIEINGEDSTSDSGQITKYQWTVTPATGISLPTGYSNSSSFKAKMTQPGTYTVALTVSDSLGDASVKETIIVSAAKPVAQFKYSNSLLNNPGLYTLDASGSYSPDRPDNTNFTYSWTIDGSPLATSAVYKVLESNPASPVVKVQFFQKKDYEVKLVVSDPNGLGTGQKLDSLPFVKTVAVTDVLDLSWGNSPSDNASGILSDSTQKAKIVQSIKSEVGTAYEVDFGDGVKEQGEIKAKTATFSHDYSQTGVYLLKVTTFDNEDNDKSISRKIIIGSSKVPVAIISQSINGEEFVSDGATPIAITRKDSIGFDAGKSKNTDGTGRKLNYSWDFGDGTRSTQKQVNHTFKDYGKYEVKLTVTNADDVSQKSTEDKVTLLVGTTPPTLRGLTALPTSGLTTPVTVKLEAIGAAIQDGKIVSYRWWYFDPKDDAQEYGIQITQTPSATVIIGARGTEGEKKTYLFGVEITDDSANKVSSMDLLDEKTIPSLEVVNGPNRAPTAKFNVDRTTIMVGDSVNFSSASVIPDGVKATYFWDFEGDGFANNTKAEPSNVTHKFESPAKNGFRVRLKVVGDNGTEAVSDPINIYVEGKAQPPVAAFTSSQEGTTKMIKFTNKSTADTAGGTVIKTYLWDFDTSTDSNGDGKKDNDEDSKEENPSKTFENYGIYWVKLTVVDSDGVTAKVANLVNVKAPAAPTTPTSPASPVKPAAPAAPVTPAPALDARMITTPAPSFVDNKVHLTGTSGDVTFDFSGSVGNIKKYVIDKNAYFDSNGNSILDDDEDYTATVPGKWTTNYMSSYGRMKAKLTVIDDQGKKDSVDKEIVFDLTAGSTMMVNVFGSMDPGLIALLVTIAGFAILVLHKQKSNGR